MLTLKEITPVRLIKNPFFSKVEEAYKNCASTDEMKTLLGRGRAKKGMFEGDLDEGELEIGQISGLIDTILPAEKIMQEILSEYKQARTEILSDKFDW